MSPIEAALRAIAAELERRRVLWALVGGLAVTARAEPRTTRDVDVVVDLLFASSGVEPEVAEAAERLEVLPGLVVPVATLGHLVALKVLARDDRTRPRDAEDLRALLAEAGPDDLAAARGAPVLVTARGFHRGKDLSAELERAVADLGP